MVDRDAVLKAAQTLADASDEVLRSCWEDATKAQERIDELEERCENLYKRHQGQARLLARIRAKADAALGYVNESGGFDEASVKGRGAGAEAAVDLLIAHFAGLQKKLAEREEELRLLRT